MFISEVGTRVDALIAVAKLRNGGAIARRRSELMQGVHMYAEKRAIDVVEGYEAQPTTIQEDLFLDSAAPTRALYECDDDGRWTCIIANATDELARFKGAETKMAAFILAVEILDDERAEQGMLAFRAQERAQAEANWAAQRGEVG